MLTYNTRRFYDQKQAFDLLKSYDPWGRPGCGAPNPPGIRRHNLMLDGIYPEKQFQRYQFPEKTSVERRRVRGRSGGRLRWRDPQLCFHPGARATVENLLRWRTPAQDQMQYKKCLDEIVSYNKKVRDVEARKNLEFDRKMGWTAGKSSEFPPIDTKSPDIIFEQIPKEYRENFQFRNTRRFSNIDKENVYSRKVPAGNPTKSRNFVDDNLPKLEHKNEQALYRGNATVGIQKKTRVSENGHNQSSNCTCKFRCSTTCLLGGDLLSGRERQGSCTRDIAPQEYEMSLMVSGRAGGTPTRQLMEMTGGVELVPLMRGRGRLSPSSVQPRRRTRDAEYLRALTEQVRMQQRRRVEIRNEDIEKGRQHTLTWEQTWSRNPTGKSRQLDPLY